MRHTQEHAWYAAFKAKDPRFDGRFFVGVSSTGIYCRPVCPARLPKEDNCAFFASAAAAEGAGYRPCLVCRPELAPGAAPIDATSSLARRAAALLEENCGNELNIAEYARRLGCSDRHLRRAFTEEFSVPPARYLQTCKLLLAKNLLADTELSVTEVAMAAGFGSVRRFNDLFKRHYRMPPTQLRRQGAGKKRSDSGVTLLLGYRPPYPWEQILGFFAGRAIPGVEYVAGSRYMRTVRYTAEEKKPVYGWLAVDHRPEKNAVAVTVSPALLPVLPRLLTRVRHAFDLLCSPDAVYETLSCMNDIRPGLCEPGTRLPGCFEPFEMSVRAVLGQQITVKAAGTLAARIAEALGAPVDTGLAGLTRVFPSAHDIAALGDDISDILGPLGVTRARSACILALARNIADGKLDFSPSAQPEAEIKKLLALPGIGAWTAQYIAMRALGWPDAFPHSDYGVRKALAPLSDKDILRTAEAWRPWRAYATINLWNSLHRQGE